MVNAVPLSLYIHFPWCIKKCPYCDFNSYQLNSPLDEKTYIDALLEDLEKDLIYVQNRSIVSIFMGGGTPSLFSPQSMDFLLSAIRERLSLSETCEITMEMNPGAIEHGNLKEYRNAGINRLSVGVQSFQEHQLKNLGRIHNSAEAIKVIQQCQESGFDNINIDLMYALPNQKVNDALSDLQQAIALKVQHISWYHLTIEPNTEFYRVPPSLPKEEISIDIETQGKSLLVDSGYDQYEISAYCQSPNRKSRHNINYWEFGDYLGIGAGAHSKITDLTSGEITRYWKKRTPATYATGEEPFLAGKRVLSKEDKIAEFMFNTLRLTEGFSLTLLQERAGLNLSDIQKPLKKAIEKGLLIQEQDHIKPTPFGFRFLNETIQLFM